MKVRDEVLLDGGGPKPRDRVLIRHRRGETRTQRSSQVETGAETGGRRIPAQGRMPGAPQKLGEAGRTLPWSLCREPSPGTPGLQTSGPQEETGCLRVISNALLGPESSEVGPRGWRSNKARMCRERRDPRITAPADGLSGGAPGHGKGRPLKRGEPRSRHHSWALEWSSSVLHRQCNSVSSEFPTTWSS